MITEPNVTISNAKDRAYQATLWFINFWNIDNEKAEGLNKIGANTKEVKK